MKINVSKGNENSRVLMQRLGYNEHRYRGQTEPNYTRRLSGARFPRLHAYVDDAGDKILIKLHLDMQESSASGSRHGGVYEHEFLDQEAARIKKYIELQRGQEKSMGQEKPKKRGLLGRIFG
jgi:hypothetical protein